MFVEHICNEYTCPVLKANHERELFAKTRIASKWSFPSPHAIASDVARCIKRSVPLSTFIAALLLTSQLVNEDFNRELSSVRRGIAQCSKVISECNIWYNSLGFQDCYTIMVACEISNLKIYGSCKAVKHHLPPLQNFAPMSTALAERIQWGDFFLMKCSLLQSRPTPAVNRRYSRKSAYFECPVTCRFAGMTWLFSHLSMHKWIYIHIFTCAWIRALGTSKNTMQWLPDLCKFSGNG